MEIGDVKCKSGHRLVELSTINTTHSEFQFQPDGRLIIGNPQVADVYDKTQYCIERYEIVCI